MVPGSEALFHEGSGKGSWGRGRSVELRWSVRSVSAVQSVWTEFAAAAEDRNKASRPGVVEIDTRCVNSQRVGRADDLASGLDHFLAFPDHAHHGAAAHVVHEVAEERLA